MPTIFNKINNKITGKKKTLKYLTLYKKVKDFTMIDSTIFSDNLALAEGVDHLMGDIVECGVWRGGMIAGFAFFSKYHHHYYLFDSFEGLPAPKELDGKSAADWAAGKHPSTYWDNCRAEIEFASNIMSQTGKKHTIVKGWFNDTIPGFQFQNKISILRLDGDWYDSTIICLKNLYPNVLQGGLIIIDDYYTWDGCSRAVHDYLSSIKSISKISRTPNGVAYIIKRDI